MECGHQSSLMLVWKLRHIFMNLNPPCQGLFHKSRDFCTVLNDSLWRVRFGVRANEMQIHEVFLKYTKMS